MGCSTFEENGNVFSPCPSGAMQNQYKERNTVPGGKQKCS